MAQIKSGKVNVQNGSSTVTGVDTEWLSDGVESTHEFTVAGDGVLYTIASVDGQEELTLSSPYAGETQDEVAYTIARDFTTPDSFPTMDFGDIETATIFTRAVRKIQSRFNSPSEVAALAAADIYTSREDGISGTDSGDFFFVISGGSYVLYSNDSGSAVEEFVFTSQQELVDALNTVFDLRDETQGFRDEVQDNFESFFSKYLGAFETDPTEDRFGNPLQDGAIYFNTDENIIKFYADGGWLDAGAVAVSAAQDAQDSAEAAAQSESNASNSASAAAQSETNAATSETNAQASADAAATSESNASDSASAAATSETNAQASADSAATSEFNAATSESNASDSAGAAATSESNAATSESNASDSADAAAQSEANASTSESNASDSEGLAQRWANEDRDIEVANGEFSAKHYSLVSQDEADRSDERATDSSFFADQSQSFMEDTEGFRNETEQFRDTTEQYKNDAETARDGAQQALFDFNGRYYGPLENDPTEDPNGDPPSIGDWYFNKPNNEVRIYTTNENWDVFSTPIESTLASESEAVEGTNNINYMTPLRTTNHFDARRQGVIDEAVSESEIYTDGEITTLDSNLRSYADSQANSAESNANSYTDNQVSSHSNQTGQVHGVPIGEEVEWKSAAQDKADSAESSANSYTDSQTSNSGNWDTAYDRSVTSVSGSGNGTLTIGQQVGSESTDLSHSHDYSDLPNDVATEGYADQAASDATSNSGNWDTAYDRSVTGVSGSGNGTLTINQQVGSETTSLAHSHDYSDLPNDVATEGYADTQASNAESNANSYTDNRLPSGVITMWSGSVSSIPSGWAICDGANGTPDLRNRMIIGAGDSYSVDDTGGSKDAVAVSHTHSASTGTSGSHQHQGNTGTGGEHSHAMFGDQYVNAGGGGDSNITEGGTVAKGVNASSFNEGYSLRASSVDPTHGETSETDGHTHTFSTNIEGLHSHTVNVNSSGEDGTDKNLPPYYALAYIMKL